MQGKRTREAGDIHRGDFRLDRVDGIGSDFGTLICVRRRRWGRRGLPSRDR